MYDLTKYLPDDLELFEEYRVEIPHLETLHEVAEFKMVLEFRKGQGMGIEYPYLVDLEPPWEPYEHTNLSDIDKHFLGYDGYRPAEYPRFKLAHIKAILNDEVQRQHILSMLFGLTSDYHISFEIVFDHKEIKIFFTLPDVFKDTLLSQLYTFFPHSQFILTNDDPVLEGHNVNLEYFLHNLNLFPLRIITDLNALTFLIELIEEIDGYGMLQILVKKCRGAWEQNYDFCTRERYKFERVQFLDFDIEKMLEDKNKPPYFAVAIRTGFSSKEVFYRLHRFLGVFSNIYQKFVPVYPNGNLPIAFLNRGATHYGMLLSQEEIVNLIYSSFAPLSKV